MVQYYGMVNTINMLPIFEDIKYKQSLLKFVVYEFIECTKNPIHMDELDIDKDNFIVNANI